jgi:hypothetical protein
MIRLTHFITEIGLNRHPPGTVFLGRHISGYKKEDGPRDRYRNISIGAMQS